MRRSSLFVRLAGVCLFSLLCVFALQAQDRHRPTEGALRISGPEGSSPGICPLKKTDVRAEVSGYLSRVTVTQTFQNPFADKIEAVYTFPLPNDAAVDEMTIEIGARTIKGEIMERKRAQLTYDAARERGQTAALLEQQRPNIFTQSVANIPPGAEIVVRISYVETLRYTDDAYEFRFPMTVGERYLPSSVGAEDAAKISPKSKARPGHTVSLEVAIDAGVPVAGIASNTHPIETAQYTASRFTARLADAEEIPNRDFVLRYRTAGGRLADALLAHRDARGGFFTLVLQPPDRVAPADAMPKEIVFVLDTSGSMDGFPIKKAKEAMRLTLDDVNPQDTFNLITFAGETRVLFEKPLPATRENLARARKWLDDSESGGGTEMMTAIRAALAPSGSESHVRIVCFMTDGQVGNDAEIIAEVRKQAHARVFAFGIGDSVNHYLLDEISRAGRGEVEYVGRHDDGSAAARRFYERIHNPLLTDIALEFEGVAAEEVYPRRIPDLFDARPVNVVGRYRTGGRGRIILRGRMQGQPYERAIEVEFPEKEENHDALATVWARRKVADLMRREDAAQSLDELKSLVTGLGIEFKILTPYTSFVAVDETNAADGAAPRRVDVPVAAPDNAEFIENYWRRREAAAAGGAGAGAGTGGGTGAGNGAAPLPGGVTETVEVTADRSDLSSSIAMVSTSGTRQTLEDLPVNGRSLQSVLLALANGAPSGENPASAASGLLSSKGQRPTSNFFTVDDLSANFGVAGDESSLAKNAGALPALTASNATNALATLGETGEATIRTMAAAKEQRFGGAQIDLVSRGGNNSLHGSAFETFGDERLNANDPFATARSLPRGAARLNQFGGTLGGPVRRDRAWFFAGYEGLRLRQPGFALTEVPDAAARLAAAPDARAVFDAFPLADGPATARGLAEAAATFANPARHDIFGLRFDVQSRSNLRFGGRYNLADSSATRRGGEFSLNTARRLDARTNSFSVWATSTPTANVVLDGRFNYSRHRLAQRFTLDDFGGARPLAPSGGFDFRRYDLAGLGAALGFGERIATEIGQTDARGKLEWLKGGHQVTLGGGFRRLAFTPGAARRERGVLIAGTGPEASSTAARAVELERALSAAPAFDELSLFAQHEWRLNSRLNLNLGLRWDSSLAPAFETPAAFLPAGAVGRTSGSFLDFAPRAALAFDLDGRGRAVVRGGAGLYFDNRQAATSEAFVNSLPYAAGRTGRGIALDATPAAALRPLFAFAPDLRTPRVWHFFGEYQQQLFGPHTLTANYTVSRGRNLWRTRTLAGDGGDYVRLFDDRARADYQALELRFDRRLAAGFAFQARYTLAKTADDFSPDAWREAKLTAPEAALDRGPADFDARHQLSVFGSYRIPALFSDGWAAPLARGWTLSALAYARSALPVDAGYRRVTDLGYEFVRPDLAPNAPLALIENGRAVFNRQAFVIPAGGRQGALGRNALRGFPLFQLDAGLARHFRLKGESRFELGVKAFNLLNHVNRAAPRGTLGTLLPNGEFQPDYYFGRPTSVEGGADFMPFYLFGGPRRLQLSARFTF